MHLIQKNFYGKSPLSIESPVYPENANSMRPSKTKLSYCEIAQWFRIDGEQPTTTNRSVLLGILWLVCLWFEIDYFAVDENSDAVVFEDAEASGGRFEGLDAAVEALGRAVADGAGEPSQNTV